MGPIEHGQFVEILCYGQTEKDGIDLGVDDNFASITGLIVFFGRIIFLIPVAKISLQLRLMILAAATDMVLRIGQACGQGFPG